MPAALQPVDIRLAATALQIGASLHILNNGSQNFSTYAAQAKGTYVSPAKLHAVSGTPRAFAVADVNHDGAQDVVAAVDGWLWVGRGLPDGNIETVEVTAVEKGQLSAVAVGDFNGDTHPDIAFAYKALNRVSLALGDGTGKFLVFPAQFYVNKEPVQIEAVDANGDGIDDLFVRCLTGRSVSALLSKKLP
ncbi:MAG: VCBS repeat-containing protein [Myxococcales bacterium]|nr:VCBS repeat-containing protein [Myxococcales bacterium]